MRHCRLRQPQLDGLRLCWCTARRPEAGGALFAWALSAWSLRRSRLLPRQGRWQRRSFWTQVIVRLPACLTTMEVLSLSKTGMANQQRLACHARLWAAVHWPSLAHHIARHCLYSALRLCEHAGRIHEAKVAFQHLLVLAACQLLVQQAAADRRSQLPDMAALQARLKALLADPSLGLASLAAELARSASSTGPLGSAAQEEGAMAAALKRMLARSSPGFGVISSGFTKVSRAPHWSVINILARPHAYSYITEEVGRTCEGHSARNRMHSYLLGMNFQSVFKSLKTRLGRRCCSSGCCWEPCQRLSCVLRWPELEEGAW